MSKDSNTLLTAYQAAKADGNYLDVSKVDKTGKGYVTLKKEPGENSTKKKVMPHVYSNTYRGARNFAAVTGRGKKEAEDFKENYGEIISRPPAAPKKQSTKKQISKSMMKFIEANSTSLPQGWLKKEDE